MAQTDDFDRQLGRDLIQKGQFTTAQLSAHFASYQKQSSTGFAGNFLDYLFGQQLISLKVYQWYRTAQQQSQQAQEPANQTPPKPIKDQINSPLPTRVDRSDSAHTKSQRSSLSQSRRHSQFALEINGYEIFEKIGEGGMGQVYRARREADGKSVAIKFLASTSSRVRKRFIREQKLMTEVQHDNVVKLLAIGKTDPTDQSEPRDWLAMELLEGQTLGEVLEERKLSVEQVLHLMKEICRGVGAIHDHNIVHRDLKPANIFVTSTGAVKIMDLGLAKTIDGETQLTQDNAILGTVHYMSPEQARGESSKIDSRSDVFALGVLLYQMFTQRFPFEADTVAQVLYQIDSAKPTPIQNFNPGVNIDLQNICYRALSKDPEDRYVNANTLLDDLERLSAGITVEASHFALNQRGVSNRLKLVVGALIAIALLVTTGLYLWNQGQLSSKRRSTLTAITNELKSAIHKIDLNSPITDEKLETNANALVTLNLQRQLAEKFIHSNQGSEEAARLKTYLTNNKLVDTISTCYRASIQNALADDQLSEATTLIADARKWQTPASTAKLWLDCLTVDTLLHKNEHANAAKLLAKVANSTASKTPELDFTIMALKARIEALQGNHQAAQQIYLKLASLDIANETKHLSSLALTHANLGEKDKFKQLVNKLQNVSYLADSAIRALLAGYAKLGDQPGTLNFLKDRAKQQTDPFVISQFINFYSTQNKLPEAVYFLTRDAVAKRLTGIQKVEIAIHQLSLGNLEAADSLINSVEKSQKSNFRVSLATEKYRSLRKAANGQWNAAREKLAIVLKQHPRSTDLNKLRACLEVNIRARQAQLKDASKRIPESQSSNLQPILNSYQYLIKPEDVAQESLPKTYQSIQRIRSQPKTTRKQQFLALAETEQKRFDKPNTLLAICKQFLSVDPKHRAALQILRLQFIHLDIDPNGVGLLSRYDTSIPARERINLCKAVLNASPFNVQINLALAHLLLNEKNLPDSASELCERLALISDFTMNVDDRTDCLSYLALLLAKQKKASKAIAAAKQKDKLLRGHDLKFRHAIYLLAGDPDKAQQFKQMATNREKLLYAKYAEVHKLITSIPRNNNKGAPIFDRNFSPNSDQALSRAKQTIAEMRKIDHRHATVLLATHEYYDKGVRAGVIAYLNLVIHSRFTLKRLHFSLPWHTDFVRYLRRYTINSSFDKYSDLLNCTPAEVHFMKAACFYYASFLPDNDRTIAEKMLEHSTAALKQNPRFAPAQIYRAHSLRMLGHIGESQFYQNLVDNLDPDYWRYLAPALAAYSCNQENTVVRNLNLAKKGGVSERDIMRIGCIADFIRRKNLTLFND